MAKIAAYADDASSNPAPVLADYVAIGVSGITADNLQAVDELIAAADKADVDTVAEVDALVLAAQATLDALVKIEAYADDASTNPAPELADYLAIGITDVTAAKLSFVNELIAAAGKTDVDTVSETQTLITNAATKLASLLNIAAFKEGKTNLTPPTLEDYVVADVTGVTSDNIALVNEAILRSSLDKVDTHAEIQTIVDVAKSPKAAKSSPIIGEDLDEGSYGAADIITISFNLPVDINEIDLTTLNAGLTNGHTFGSDINGASVSANDEALGYATSFTITLGTDASVEVNDVITIPKENILDSLGNAAVADVVFNVPIPMIGPTAAAVDPIVISDSDSSNSYSLGDGVIVSFSSAVLIEKLDISQFSLGGKSLGIGAAVIPIDSDGTYATSFRIILGFNPTLTEGEQISVAHASVVDTKGRQANNDIKFTLPDVVLPTIASMNAIATNDLDGSGDFNAGDTIVVSFSELVDIYSLTMDVVNTFSLSNGHSFGTDFTVAAIGEVDGFSSQFIITLGDAPSIAEADSLIIDVDKVKDKAGNKPAADLTLSIPSIIVPAADDTNPIAVSEAGGGTIGVYDAGDTITFKFNKPVATSLALSDLTVGSKSFGAGATLTAGSESPAGYAAEFTLTLGSNTDVTQGDEVSVLAVKVIDQSDTLALDNVVFTLPDITPPQAIGNAIPGDSGALVGSYDVGDTLTVNFSEAIQLSEMTD